MSVIDTITVDLAVVVGEADLPIRQLLKMGRGAMIALDAGQDDPSLLFVNGELVARGHVQVSGERISIEVAEIVRRSNV